jgi:hypothetical protein
MGWWPIGSGDEVMGDIPADIVVDTMELIVAGRTARGAARPTMQQLVNAIAAALLAAPESYLDDPQRLVDHRVGFASAAPASGPSASAPLGNRPHAQPTVAQPEAADQEMTAAVSEALAEISQVYQDSFRRKPRLVEALDAFSFVVCSPADEYLSEAIPRLCFIGAQPLKPS